MGWSDVFKKNVGRGSGSSQSYFPTAATAAGAVKAAGSKAAPVVNIVKSAGRKAAPVLGRVAGAAGNVAGGIGTAGTAAKGVIFGGAAAAGASLVNSFADPGFILFIAGLLTFIFNEYVGNPALAILIGTIFMFYSTIFIFKARGLLLVIVFWLWYIVFGRVTDPLALMYTIFPIVLTAMAIHGLFSKISGRGSFVQGAGGELTGLLPVLFFFLDLGLLDFLTKTLGLPVSPLLENLMLFTPWWAILGLFTTEKQNFFITLARVVGITYVFLILTIGVVPEAYAHQKSLVPGPEQFLQAKKELQQQLPQKENPFISQMACLFGGELTDVQACVDRRQEESKLKFICEVQEQQQPDTPGFKDCLQEQKKRQQQQVQVGGIQDPTIKTPTTAEFIVSDYFPKSTFRTATSPPLSYPVEFKVQNLRSKLKEEPALKEEPLRELEPFQVEFSCTFMKEMMGIPGKAEPSNSSFSEETKSITVVCSPDEGTLLDGNYKLVYNATLRNLLTISRLQRVFIGQKSISWKEQWLPQLMQTYFSSGRHLSQSPADFAQLHFAFGNPLENPIIEKAESVIFSSSIKNAGRGKITAVHSYYFNLEPAGFTVKEGSKNNNCLEGPLEGTDLPLSSSSGFSQSIYLPTCSPAMPPFLQQPTEEYVYFEFLGVVSYDYRISTEVPLDVKVMTT